MNTNPASRSDASGDVAPPQCGKPGSSRHAAASTSCTVVRRPDPRRLRANKSDPHFRIAHGRALVLSSCRPPYGHQPQAARTPPSQLIVVPTTQEDAGDSRKVVTSLISSGSGILPACVAAWIGARSFSLPRSGGRRNGVSIQPSATAFTRTPRPRHCAPSDAVRFTMPAFAAT